MGLWDNFVGEIQKTFAGSQGPHKGDVSGFVQGATQGGQAALGAPFSAVGGAVADAWNTPALTPTGNTTEDFWAKVGQDYGPGYAQARRLVTEAGDVPVALRTDAPELPADLVALEEGKKPHFDVPGMLARSDWEPPLPEATLASIEQPDIALQKALAVPKKSSRAKQKSAASADVAQASSQPAEAPTSNTAATAKPDDIQKLLQERRSQFAGDREKALADAKAQENLTDDEKVAFALLGALPGLIGLIGGAAAGGGAGAAAGAAGGLQGGAQGMQQIATAKSDKRKQALAQADKAGDKLARVGDQELERAEQVANQGFQAGQAAEGRKFTAAQSEKELAARAREGALNRGLRREEMQTDLMKAGIAAAAKAKTDHPDLKDFQGKATQFATSMLVAKHDLDNMKDPSFWNTMSSWSGLKSALSDPKRQRYARAAFNFIDAVTRDVSGAAITPDEWETKFRQYLPAAGSSPDDIAFAQRFRDAALSTMLAKAGPGAEYARQSAQTPGPTGGQSQQPQASNKQRYGF